MLPFGVVGLSAGFALQAVAQPDGAGTSVAIVLLTALFALALGAFLGARASAHAFWVLVLASIPAAGAVEGVILTLAVWLPSHTAPLYGGPATQPIVRGALLGASLSAPFVPAFAAVVFAARRLGTARTGSLIDGAHRRGVWVAAAASSAATIVVAFALWHRIDAFAVFVASSGCALVLLIAFFVNVDSTVKLVRYRAPARQRSGAAGPLVVDYGVGEEVCEREHAAEAAYRENARGVVVYRGTRSRALRALLLSTAASGFAFALVLASSVVAFVR